MPRRAQLFMRLTAVYRGRARRAAKRDCRTVVAQQVYHKMRLRAAASRQVVGVSGYQRKMCDVWYKSRGEREHGGWSVAGQRARGGLRPRPRRHRSRRTAGRVHIWASARAWHLAGAKAVDGTDQEAVQHAVLCELPRTTPAFISIPTTTTPSPATL